MEAVVARENMVKALHRVEKNKGAAGVDEMTVGELRSYLKVQWPRIKEELLNGEYKPQAVRRVEIPKHSGGMRQLGIPTVVDRLIQQALHHRHAQRPWSDVRGRGPVGARREPDHR